MYELQRHENYKNKLFVNNVVKIAAYILFKLLFKLNLLINTNCLRLVYTITVFSRPL